MVRTGPSRNSRSVVRLSLQTPECEDTGAAVVLGRRPLTLLVPTHLIELIHEGSHPRIFVDGTLCEGVKLLSAPALQQDHLSVLRLRKSRIRGLSMIRLARRPSPLRAGQKIRLRRPAPFDSLEGTIQDIGDHGDGLSISTDIPVISGDSGSPLMADGHLLGICQGMIQRDGVGSAVAVPLSNAGLSELRAFRRRNRVSLITSLTATLLLFLIAFLSFALYSPRDFVLASVEIVEDGHVILGRNARRLTLHPVWTRTYETAIRRSEAFASRVDGSVDRIAVGTQYEPGSNGVFRLLDSRGKAQWSYAVPNGECIYATDSDVYDGYTVDVIHITDLDGDGTNEILVVFVHNHHEPCKLVAFDLDGHILAEYWHPGYIRNIGSGPVGVDGEMLVALSASNNAIASDWWNPQTLFAFRAEEIYGLAPPYDYLGATLHDELPRGAECWYKVILNLDPDRIRAKCREIDIRDFDGDGINEIQFALTDGRFYYLDENGKQRSVRLGDTFQREFPGEAAPPLMDIADYTAQFPPSP